MERAVFWEVTPRTLAEKYRRFTGTPSLDYHIIAVKMTLTDGSRLLQAALRRVRAVDMFIWPGTRGSRFR
jgi:hypothetical protein